MRVLDLAPLSAARADATFDGLHYVREVPAAAVDAARGAPPAATPAELRGGIADEALDRFVGTFLS